MGQLDFFDLSRRYECLDAKNDPLVAIAALVPWECFRPKLRAALINGELRTSETARKSPARRKPWDEVVILQGAGSAGALQSFGRLGGIPASRPPLVHAFSRPGTRGRGSPTPRPCGSIARRWRRRVQWKSCSIYLTGS